MDIPRLRSLVSFVMVAALSACGASSGDKSGGRDAAATPSPMPKVKTSVASIGTISPSESLAGIVAPYQNVAISSDLTEPAVSVTVEEGDRVTKGEVIARLDTSDLEANLASDLANARSAEANTRHTVGSGELTIAQSRDSLSSSKAGVAQAQATLDRDRADLARYSSLLGNGYVSRQQYDQQAATVRVDEQALRSASASASSARSQVAANGSIGADGTGLQQSSVDQSRAQEQVALAAAQQVRVQISKATIVSPIDGVVVNRNLNPGEYPGSRQIFTLQQVDPIYVQLRGSGQQIARVEPGGSATITSADLSRGSFVGKVVGVLNQINPGSTDFQVKVVLANPQGRLRPGMAVSGLVRLPEMRGVRVPKTAFTDDSESSVYTVASDGTVKTVKVTLRGEDGKSALVDGLASGSRVIDDGQSAVSPGQKVAQR